MALVDDEQITLDEMVAEIERGWVIAIEAYAAVPNSFPQWARRRETDGGAWLR